MAVSPLRLAVLFALSSCAVPELDPGPAPGNDPADVDDTTTDDDDTTPESVEVDWLAALVRASLDLRGVRPSLDELEAIATVEDPEATYAQAVEDYLVDDRFGDRVREIFSVVYLTHMDYYYVTAADYGNTDEVTFARSVGDEPLRILARIATEDMPYTEIVLGDWTMANEVLAEAFPVDYPDDQTGWQVAQYNDGRPVAGVLSTNGMWWRYTSTDSNANRGRANALSRILTCHDYLSLPIEFDRNVNLLDTEALEDALRTNSGCVACHNSLDPLASYLYGFYHYLYFSKMELTYYHPEREQMWEERTGVAPAYMGEPGYNLQDLGAQIAADARLTSCITEQVHDLLLDRDHTLDDTATLTSMRDAFIDDGLVLRTLFRSVVTSDEYVARVDADGTPQRKMVTPDQLASSVEDITGYRFSYAGYDLLQSDSYGVRTLAGGVDGVYATKPAKEPTATIALVHERIGQAAASYVTETDRDDPDNARLFTEIDFRETPDTERDPMVAQIQALYLRILGTELDADSDAVDDLLDLWSDLYDVERDTEAAWAGVASVLLRDADFLFY